MRAYMNITLLVGLVLAGISVAAEPMSAEQIQANLEMLRAQQVNVAADTVNVSANTVVINGTVQQQQQAPAPVAAVPANGKHQLKMLPSGEIGYTEMRGHTPVWVHVGWSQTAAPPAPAPVQPMPGAGVRIANAEARMAEASARRAEADVGAYEDYAPGAYRSLQVSNIIGNVAEGAAAAQEVAMAVGAFKGVLGGHGVRYYSGGSRNGRTQASSASKSAAVYTANRMARWHMGQGGDLRDTARVMRELGNISRY